MESQARPTILAGGRVLELPKGLEDRALRLLRNANPRVCHAKLHAAFSPPGGHGDTATGSKLHRVAEQILEDNLELARVGVEHRQGLFALPDELQRGLLLQPPGLGPDLLQY